MELQFFFEWSNNRNGRKMKWGKNGGERGHPSRGVRKREIKKERGRGKEKAGKAVCMSVCARGHATVWHTNTHTRTLRHTR